MDPSKKRKLIASVAFGIMGGILFIAVNSGDVKLAFVCGSVIGLILITWIFYFLWGGITRAKKFAQDSIEAGFVADRVKAERVIAFLNLQQDTESKYLLVKLKEILLSKKQ